MPAHGTKEKGWPFPFVQVCDPNKSSYDARYQFENNYGCLCKDGLDVCDPADLSHAGELYVWLWAQTVNQGVSADGCGSPVSPASNNVRLPARLGGCGSTGAGPWLQQRPAVVGTASAADARRLGLTRAAVACSPLGGVEERAVRWVGMDQTRESTTALLLPPAGDGLVPHHHADHMRPAGRRAAHPAIAALVALAAAQATRRQEPALVRRPLSSLTGRLPSRGTRGALTRRGVHRLPPAGPRRHPPPGGTPPSPSRATRAPSVR